MTALPMIGLLTVLLTMCGLRSRLPAAMCCGLLLAAGGDMTGLLPLKLAAFAAAHVAYCVGFWPYRSRADRRLLVLAVPVITLTVLIGFGQPPILLAGLACYGLLLTGMVCLASGLGRSATVGGVLFMASDVLVGWSAVHRVPVVADLAALAVYVVAQGLLVAAVIRADRWSTTPAGRAPAERLKVV